MRHSKKTFLAVSHIPMFSVAIKIRLQFASISIISLTTSHETFLRIVCFWMRYLIQKHFTIEKVWNLCKPLNIIFISIMKDNHNIAFSSPSRFFEKLRNTVQVYSMKMYLLKYIITEQPHITYVLYVGNLWCTELHIYRILQKKTSQSLLISRSYTFHFFLMSDIEWHYWTRLSTQSREQRMKLCIPLKMANDIYNITCNQAKHELVWEK